MNEEIMNIINKLFTIEEVLIQDDLEGHGSAYEMQFEDFVAIHGLLDIIKKKNEIIKKQSYTNKKMRKTLKTVRKERNKLNKEIKDYIKKDKIKELLGE